MAEVTYLRCENCSKQVSVNSALRWLRIIPIGIDVRTDDFDNWEGDFCSPNCIYDFIFNKFEEEKARIEDLRTRGVL